MRESHIVAFVLLALGALAACGLVSHLGWTA